MKKQRAILLQYGKKEMDLLITILWQNAETAVVLYL